MSAPEQATPSQWRDPADTSGRQEARHLSIVSPEPLPSRVAGVVVERSDLESLERYHADLWQYMLGWIETVKWRERCEWLRAEYLDQRSRGAKFWTGVEALLLDNGLAAVIPELIALLPEDKGALIAEFDRSLLAATDKVQVARNPQQDTDLGLIANDVRTCVIAMQKAIMTLEKHLETHAAACRADSSGWVRIMRDRLDNRAAERPQAAPADRTKTPEEADPTTVGVHEPEAQSPKTPELRFDLEAIRQALMGSLTVVPDVAAHGLTSSSRPWRTNR